jgi:hypothetical protein
LLKLPIEGQHNKVQETRLRLSHVDCLTVAQERHRQVLSLLNITLLEELFEEQVRPSVNDLKLARAVGYVASMLNDLHQLLLRLEERVGVSSVDELAAVVVSFGDLHDLASSVECVHIFFVLRHISCQDQTNDALAENFDVLRREVDQEVEFRLEQNRQGLCRVVVLLDRGVVVTKTSLGHPVDMVGVGKAVMIEVVTHGSCQEGDHIEVGQLRDFVKFAVLDETEGHLRYVCTVQVVVVLDIFAVSLLNLVEEPD